MDLNRRGGQQAGFKTVSPSRVVATPDNFISYTVPNGFTVPGLYTNACYSPLNLDHTCVHAATYPLPYTNFNSNVDEEVKMKPRILLICLAVCLLLGACDWNPLGIPRDLKIRTVSELGPDTLARIDAINKTLDEGVNIGKDTRKSIAEVNATISETIDKMTKEGIKVGFDAATLSNIDRLITLIENDPVIKAEIGLDDKTLNTVNGLIGSIDATPNRWKQTAEEIIRTLEGSSKRVAVDMAQQVRLVVEDARLNTQKIVATTGVEFRCNVDFLGMRAGSTIDEFIGRSIVGRLKAIIAGEKDKPGQPTPWVCGIIPDQVTLSRKNGKSVFEKGVITITGYNYVDANMPQVLVKDENGASLDAIRLQARRTSAYQFQINLQDVDFSPAPARAWVVLQWPNVVDTCSIAIILPERLPELTIQTSGTTVYEGPGNEYRPLGLASQGANYTVKGRTGNSSWWQIDYKDGQTGWVEANAVTRNDNMPVGVATNIPLLPPLAVFKATPLSGSAPLQVTFEDQSTRNPTAWFWEFGDGSTSAAPNPVHTYSQVGAYNVRLKVSNAQGENTKIEQGFIIVEPAPPPAVIASFRADPLSGVAPLEVFFSDTSQNSPISWQWDFGDGVQASGQLVKHTYTVAGVYTVKLTASNANSSDTKTQQNLITITAPPPKANFTANLRSGMVPLAVRFIDQSGNGPTSWQWDFGDGDTSSEQNPTHTYLRPTPYAEALRGKSYDVTLTVTNAQGSDTMTQRSFITLQALPACVNTDFVSDDDQFSTGCPDGYAAAGIRCRGDYCDNVSLYCCPYLEAEVGNSGGQYHSERYWSNWFSEEWPGSYTDNNSWVAGLACAGSYCDSLRLWFLHTSDLSNTGYCTYLDAVSEEEVNGRKCDPGWFISGMKCSGSYCDGISLYCCLAR